MRRLPRDVEEAIVNRLLEGATYSQCAREFGLSLATINRVAEDARKRLPDFDRLRQLSILLKKSGSNVFDSIRGAKLLERLNELDVSLEKLGRYLNLMERLFSEEVLDNTIARARIVEYAIRLLQLEEKYGITYEEIVEAFEIKLSEVKELGSQKEVLEAGNKALRQDGEKARTELDALLLEIRNLVTTQNRIKDVGIEKLDSSAEFIQEFEFLGYNIDEVHKLAELKKRLIKNKIDPNKLEEYLKQKISLNRDIHKLEIRKAGLQNQVNTIEKERKTLLAVTSVLSLANEILTERRLLIQCKFCATPFWIGLDTLENYENMTRNGLWVTVPCQSCGYLNQFHPHEIIFSLGWQIVSRIRRRL